MKMKTLISLLLVLAMVAGLCACGNDGGNDASDDSDSPYVENATYRYLYSREAATMN